MRSNNSFIVSYLKKKKKLGKTLNKKKKNSIGIILSKREKKKVIPNMTIARFAKLPESNRAFSLIIILSITDNFQMIVISNVFIDA